MTPMGDIPCIEVVAATDSHRGIGLDGTIPWRLPQDMAHFRKLTRGVDTPDGMNAVIMGRKTWDSIPERFRPLAERLNLVVSRNRELPLPDGVCLSHGLDDALLRVRDLPNIERCFVIGGASLYAEALSHSMCRALHITRIDASFRCDVFFPEIPPTFELEWCTDDMEEGELRFRFERYLVSDACA